MYSKRIKQRRQEINLGQADLAKMTGISQSMISAYENGKNSPTAEVLTILSNALDVSADWLLGKTNEQLEDVVLSDDETQLIEAWRRGDSATIVRLFADKLAKSRSAE